MPLLDDQLARIVTDVRNGNAPFSDSLAELLRQVHNNDLLTFSLESAHGQLFVDGPAGSSSAGNENNLAALPALCGDLKNKKRFFCTLTERHWEVLSTFLLSEQPFFTTVSLDIVDPGGSALRSGLFKLVDYFTLQCRRFLYGYLNGFALPPAGSRLPGGKFPFEIGVLRQVVDFSHDVQCAVLLDDDGFIVHTEGNSGGVDELGSALSRLFQRCRREPCLLSGADYTAITLADQEFTIKIGRLPGTTLVFAVSAGGSFAMATTSFLHRVAADALCAYARREGHLWGVTVTPPPEAARIRRSWFSAPHLVAHGKFVGKKGGKSFHTVECQVLSKTNPTYLAWFDNRAGAIASGMRPCSTCNP